MSYSTGGESSLLDDYLSHLPTLNTDYDHKLFASALHLSEFARYLCEESAQKGIALQKLSSKKAKENEDPLWTELMDANSALENTLPLPRTVHWAEQADIDRLTWFLAHPPKDSNIREHRQDVFRELQSSPQLQQNFLYARNALRHFRERLRGPEQITEVDRLGFRLGQLRAFNATLEAIGRLALENSDSVGAVRNCGLWAQSQLNGEPIKQLRALLNYSVNRSSASLRIELDIEGKPNKVHFDFLKDNPAPEGRPNFFKELKFWFLTRVRGARLSRSTLFNLCLESITQPLLSSSVLLLQLADDFELISAGLAFTNAAKAAGLETCLSQLVSIESIAQAKSNIDIVNHSEETTEDTAQLCPRKIRGLFNPLLLATGHSPVSCDLDLGQGELMVLLTGPNSGGKTRLLQSMAWLQLLSQCGFPAPAAQAELLETRQLLVSFGEEIAAGQTEGRLGMELKRIRHIFESAGPHAMIVLDELCSGTHPAEGAELFQTVVEQLLRLHPQALLSTHFLERAELIQKSHHSKHCAFLSASLDENWRPTYGFSRGISRSAMAERTAERLGVTAQELSKLVDLAWKNSADTADKAHSH